MPELPLGFLEHAQWQHNGMHAKRLADLEWWNHQLQGAPLQPLLTTDIPRSGKANIGQNPGNTVQVGRLVSPDCGACVGLLQGDAVTASEHHWKMCLCARLPLVSDFSPFQ